MPCPTVMLSRRMMISDYKWRKRAIISSAIRSANAHYLSNRIHCCTWNDYRHKYDFNSLCHGTTLTIPEYRISYCIVSQLDDVIFNIIFGWQQKTYRSTFRLIACLLKYHIENKKETHKTIDFLKRALAWFICRMILSNLSNITHDL